MVSEPPDAISLAVALIHEYQHIALGGLIHLLRLTEEDDGSLYYAPWRDDPRPLSGLLQGVYAFLGIAGFWRRHRHAVTGPAAALADMEYAYARAQTLEAARIVRDAPTLTPKGRQFVASLIRELAAWSADEVQGEAVRLASLNVDSHRAGWRLRHLHPDAGEVSVLAKSWAAGEAAYAATRSRIVVHPDIRWHQRIPALTRLQAKGDQLPAVVDSHGWDLLSGAENALVEGDVANAADAYQKAFVQAESSSNDSLRAWVGLVLTKADRDLIESKALRERPELVRALQAEIVRLGGGADPIAVARWLAQACVPVG
jgi:hypothetical protein